MLDPFTLSVPPDAGFHDVAAEIAGKYVELAGGTAADARSLATSLTGALERVASDAGQRDGLLCEFSCDGGRIGVTVRCRDAVQTVTQSVGSLRPRA